MVRFACMILVKRDALRPELSWTHYRLLMRVANEVAREFYQKVSIEGTQSPVKPQSEFVGSGSGRQVLQTCNMRFYDYRYMIFCWLSH
jgi:hypothetical protein